MQPWIQMALTVITSVLASGGLWSYIQYRQERKFREEDKEEQKDSTESKALKALLHDRIYQGCKEAIKDGNIDAEDYENLQYLYHPYKDLGGNGTCERLMTAVEQLPIEIKEGKHEQ